MSILPVMDLLEGQVVRGVGGCREEYRPILSVLCADAKPVTVGRAFAQGLGFREVYVADLDAIQGAEPAWDVYRELTGCGLGLWLDAGLSDVRQARRMSELEVSDIRLAGIVAGLESVPGPGALVTMLDHVGPGRLVFSLDLKNGRPLTDSPEWRNVTPESILDQALRIGIQRFIILDLAQVGVGKGVGTESICRDLRRCAPRTQITAGGGIRSVDDVLALQRIGCDAVLVASALHDGRITEHEVSMVNVS